MHILFQTEGKSHTEFLSYADLSLTSEISEIMFGTQKSRTIAVIPNKECIVQEMEYKVHLHSFASPWDVILQMQF